MLESDTLRSVSLFGNLVRAAPHGTRSFARILQRRLCANRGNIAVRSDKDSRSGFGEDLRSMCASHLVKQLVPVGKLQVRHAITWVQPSHWRTRGQAAPTVVKGELIRRLSAFQQRLLVQATAQTEYGRRNR